MLEADTIRVGPTEYHRDQFSYAPYKAPINRYVGPRV